MNSEEVINGAVAAFRRANSVETLDESRREYLSANGKLKSLLRGGNLRADARSEAEAEFEKAVNRVMGAS